MQRREFLTLAASSLALGALGARSAFAAENPGRAAFAAALREQPWLLGWRGVDSAALDCDALAIEGAWPSDLAGSFYRNGPAVHELRGTRLEHWFDPDGMVHRYAIGGGRVSHRGRVVATQKYVAESSGEQLRQGFGTTPEGAPPLTSPDAANVANISLLPHAGRLFALWEAGSPHELDPNTLATLGPHAWSPETKGLPFTAHPRRDVDGTIWAFGYALAANLLVLYEIDAAGQLVRAAPVPVPALPMVHDFAITERHLVVVLPPFVPELGSAATLVDSFRWRGASEPARVLVIDKGDFSKVRQLEMPAHFTFHYGNAWEESDGTIRVDHARYADARVVTETFRNIERGDWHGHWATHHLITIPPNGPIREERLVDGFAGGEFPQFDRRRAGRRHRRVNLVLRSEAGSAQHPYFDTLGRLDLESGKLERFAFGASVLPEEHLFVPKAGSGDENAGYLLGTALDFERGTTQLNVFDAQHLADGPLAVARLPYPIPLGFHGAFVPS